MIDEITKKLNNKNIAILGFGMEGKSTYRFLNKYCENISITIIDKADIRENFKSEFDGNPNFVVGDSYLDNLDIYDVIIKTPGISLKDIDISLFKNKITSQIELMLEVNKQNCIGVTGTKGKSTTSSLIYSIIKDQNKDVYLVGNIGKPVFDEIENYKKDSIIVMEMSSHQLEFLKVSPHIGIILNLFEDHLDHAGTLYHYHQIKLNMFYNQQVNDISIYNYDNEYLRKYMEKINLKSQKISISFNERKNVYLLNDDIYYENKKLYDIKNKRYLLGEHNTFNISVALLVAEILNLDIDKAVHTVNHFKPLRYRNEYIGCFNDVKYYVDTLATIPAATIQSIEALKDVDTLIFGGMDRGIDYQPLIEYLNQCNISNLICMPTTGYNIGKKIKGKNIYYIDNLKEATEKAKEVTSKGKSCLLSPAAPSYEYFKNYAEKAEKFIECVKIN
jgi:UDP-N-acetylmuramoylalanine--D-glutamate ligase